MRALREWLEREGGDLPLHLTLLLLLLVPVGEWNHIIRVRGTIQAVESYFDLTDAVIEFDLRPGDG